MNSSFFVYFLALTLALDLVHSLSLIPPPHTSSAIQLKHGRSISRSISTRGAFLAGVAVLMTPNLALAANVPEGIKGTKEDPAFQACLSKCVYECTKPKGGLEQRVRAECLPECKQKCATTKEQLLRGTAIKKF